MQPLRVAEDREGEGGSGGAAGRRGGRPTHHLVAAAHKDGDGARVGRALNQQHAVAGGAKADLPHALGVAQLGGVELLRGRRRAGGEGAGGTAAQAGGEGAGEHTTRRDQQPAGPAPAGMASARQVQRLCPPSHCLPMQPCQLPTIPLPTMHPPHPTPHRPTQHHTTPRPAHAHSVPAASACPPGTAARCAPPWPAPAAQSPPHPPSAPRAGRCA